MRGRRLRWGTPLAALGLGLLLALVPWPTTWVEVGFARTWFPLVAAFLAPVTSAVPWSLSVTLLIALLASLVAAMVGARSRRRLPRAGLWLAAILLITFVGVWGAAYRRATLAELLRLPDVPLSEAQVDAGRSALLLVVRSTASTASPTRSSEKAAAACVAAAVETATGVRVKVPTRVKRLPAGTQLRFGFAGVTSPWLLEPHIDAGLPPVAALATATHELTHAAGFAREADTDALAVLAGLACDDPTVRYALALHAYAGVVSGSAAAQRQALLAALPDRAVADLRADSAAADSYRIEWLSRGASAAYDRYLRSQGMSAGMGDYDRATDLVLRALAARGVPVVRSGPDGPTTETAALARRLSVLRRSDR